MNPQGSFLDFEPCMWRKSEDTTLGLSLLQPPAEGEDCSLVQQNQIPGWKEGISFHPAGTGGGGGQGESGLGLSPTS